MTPQQVLARKIRDRTAVVGVIGLGYVGLPLALEKAKVGFRVVGVDQNPERVARVNSGQNYISDVADEELAAVVADGHLSATTDFSRVPEMDVIVICVPTPLTKNLTPDLQYVEKVASNIEPHLRSGQLVSLESTTYPGTTEEVILPILEQRALKLETDLFLAYSPERVDPGNKRYTTKNTNKVVGAVGPCSLEVAVEFYSQTIVQVVRVSSAKVAELVKIYENTFRAVNIALVNELALLCDHMDLDVWEVLDAAFTKPFGIMPFYPGPGVGGHCIPIDPHYLEWKAKEFNFNTHFIAMAGEVNRRMPGFVREKTMRVMNRLGVVPRNSRVLVLGVAYKRDVADWRESPCIEVIRLLQCQGVHVEYHDPHVPEFSDNGVALNSVPLTPEALRAADLVIVATDHTAVDYDFVVEHSRHVLDTRNATKKVKNGRDRITLL